MKLLLLLSIISFGCYAGSEILFETDFNELPSGWYAGAEWIFGSFGASLCFSIVDTSYTEILTTEAPVPVYYAVPAGADSVKVNIEHWVFLAAGDTKGEDPSSTAMIQIWTNQSSWGDYLFFHSVSNELYTNQDPISYTLHDPQPGTELGFRFIGELISETPSVYAEIIWTVESMTVTAYGDGMSLEISTWASLKSILGSQ